MNNGILYKAHEYGKGSKMRKIILPILILFIFTANVVADHISDDERKYPKLSFRYAAGLSMGAIGGQHRDNDGEFTPLGISGHITLIDIPIGESDLSFFGIGAGAIYGMGKHHRPYSERFWKKGTVLKIPIIYFSGWGENGTFGVWYGTNKYLHQNPLETVHFIMFEGGMTSLGRWFW